MLVATISLRSPDSEEMTCSRPIYGPNNLRPSLYGPGDGPLLQSSRPEPKHPGCRASNTQMIEDDGKASSDSATRNPNNLPVYSYSPAIAQAFPTEGAPMPYLNDFGGFGR